MTDQLPNNTQVASGPPANPTVLPDAPPPQDIAVDPIPLPSSSPFNMVNPSMESVTSSDINIETVVEPEPVKMPEAVIDPVPETIAELPAVTEEKLPETVSPVPEEDPSVIRPPQPSTDQSTTSSQQHNKISKKVIAGITGLVFLISGLSVGIYFNSQNFGVLDSRRYAADNMCNVDPSRNCGSDPKEWEKGWIDARKKENEGAIPVQNEYTNANDDQNKNPQDGVQAEIIRHAGDTGVGDPGAGNRTGETITVSGGAANNPSPTTAVSSGTCGPNKNQVCNCLPNSCVHSALGSPGGRLCSADGMGLLVTSCSESGSIYTCGCDYGTVNGSVGPATCWYKGSASTSYATGHVDAQNNCGSGPAGTPNPTATTRPGSPSPTPTTKPGGGGGGGGGNEPTVPPGSSPTPVTISANCQSLIGQTKDNAGAWVDRTDTEFIGYARAGDQVRFVCTGHKTQGNFTKAAFFINNILHVDDVIKLSVDKYAVPFTIPASGSLEIEAVLLHDSKGWVD